MKMGMLCGVCVYIYRTKNTRRRVKKRATIVKRKEEEKEEKNAIEAKVAHSVNRRERKRKKKKKNGQRGSDKKARAPIRLFVAESISKQLCARTLQERCDATEIAIVCAR